MDDAAATKQTDSDEVSFSEYRTLREDDIMAEWDTEDIVQQAAKMAKLKHKIH